MFNLSRFEVGRGGLAASEHDAHLSRTDEETLTKKLFILLCDVWVIFFMTFFFYLYLYFFFIFIPTSLKIFLPRNFPI